MDFNTITKLLERYENGTSTLQEDAILQQYFLSNNVAPQLAHYKPLFAFYNNQKQIQYTKPLPTQKKHSIARHWKWLSIAAITILMLGIYIPTTTNITKRLEDYTQTEQELYHKTKHALKLFSANFSKGTQSMQTLQLVDYHFEKGQNSAKHVQQFGNITQQLLK